MVKVSPRSADPERTVNRPPDQNEPGWCFTSADYSVPEQRRLQQTATQRRPFPFSANQDSVNDDGESVKLGFGSSLPTGVTAGSTDETTVSITDNDVPSVTVSFEQASYTVAEGDSVNVKVTLSAEPERTITIPVTSTETGRRHFCRLQRPQQRSV